MILTTLVVIHNDEKILLGLKKRGFGQGRWNGFGGKVHPGESLEQAATRELEEESGLKAIQMTPRGQLIFSFQDDTESVEVQIFHCEQYSGEPIETDEMRPQWFDHTEIPYSEMWVDDKHWLPIFLKGQNIKGHFRFDAPGTQNILSHTIEGYE